MGISVASTQAITNAMEGARVGTGTVRQLALDAMGVPLMERHVPNPLVEALGVQRSYQAAQGVAQAVGNAGNSVMTAARSALATARGMDAGATLVEAAEAGAVRLII